jgi:hypothetical protein
MRKITVVAAAFCLALVSGAAVAQTQGPASPNYSLGGPNGPPPAENNQTAQPRNPNVGQGTYNYVPGQGNNQVRRQQRRGTTGYRQ